MSRHSKNCTASSFFTYEEKRKLKYGTIHQRLGGDSVKDFDVCCICLKQAEEPHACPSGHLFCKECIYESLLVQKKKLKAAMAQYEREQQQNEAAVSDQEILQKESEIAAFERAETSLLPTTEDSSEPHDESSSSVAELYAGDGDRRKKQKVGYDPKIKSFWLPSMAPSEAKNRAQMPDKYPRCPEGGKYLRLKQLRVVKFGERCLANGVGSKRLRRSGVAKEYECVSCQKALTNACKTVLLCGCGHVVCSVCYDRLVKPEKACVTCGAKVDHQKPHRRAVPLQVGGTGFAGHGAQTTAKIVTPAFQA